MNEEDYDSSPHFGTDEEMLKWCRQENLTPRKDSEGEWDWLAVYKEWMERDKGLDEEEEEL